jgi:hypothetical protein
MSQLELRTKLRRAFSNSYKAQFGRLLGIGLTSEELRGIEDCTLCLSFMRLEMIEKTLVKCSSVSEAREELWFLIASSLEYRDSILAALNTGAVNAGISFGYDENMSLLEYDEAILAQIKMRPDLN